MKKLLFINACTSNHHPSRTKYLCKAYLEKMRANYEIEEINLDEIRLMPLTKEQLDFRDQCVAQEDYSDPFFTYARKMVIADRIVIGAPYWDLSFPSALKVFIEHIMVNGLTFYYEDNQPHGLCNADKLVFIMSAGGFLPAHDMATAYLSAIAHMIGVQDIQTYCAQGLDVEGADVKAILEDCIEIME